MKKLVYLFISLLLLSYQILGQNSTSKEIKSLFDGYPKHAVDLRIGFGDHSAGGVYVGIPGVSVDVGTGGFLIGLRYNYLPNPNYAFTFSTAVMASEVRVEALSNYTSTVIPIMMGMKYYFTQLDGAETFLPYISGSLGVIIGTENAVEFTSVGIHTETAFGGNIGLGTDIILGSLIKLHTDLGYNLYTDFKEQIGGRNNYSGAEFSFGIGFMF